MNVENDNSAEEVTTCVENGVEVYKTNLIISQKFFSTKGFANTLKTLGQSLDTCITFESIKSGVNTDATETIITIIGQNKSQVIETKMKLSKLLLSVRQQMPFTHLITVPFNNESMRQQFCRFKDLVLTQFKDCKRIDENLFQTPEKLHLTLCVLVLLNEDEISTAKQILRESLHQIVNPLLDNKPLRVAVEGLDVMNSDPNKAHVLYARINDPLNHFQTIADAIVGQYTKSGLCRNDRKDTDKVKLHVTFMNSLFRQRIKSKSNESKKKFKRIKREPFEAKRILEYYNSYKFSDLVIESIQLNDISTKTEEGFYGLTEKLELQKD